ncbi:hypothetical protein BDV18DRAFT_24926 [Aspergillus unguis]
MPDLTTLPNELLLDIFSPLPTITKHTLSLTCQQLNTLFAPLCPTLTNEERYALRTELARDGFRLRNHIYCSACHTVHMQKFFTLSQLHTPPPSRVCLYRQNQLLIEPGKFWSFHDVSCQKSAWEYSSPGSRLPADKSTVVRVKMGKNRYTDRCVLAASYQLLTMPSAKSLSRDEVGRVLCGFDLPVCPHARMSDFAVVESYDSERHCSPGWTEAAAATCSDGPEKEDVAVAVRCGSPGCDTTFSWECRTHPAKAGWKTLFIHTRRHLGLLMSPHDTRWMAQGVNLKDEARLEAHWKECFEWRDVNMVIEEMRFEREMARGGVLDQDAGNDFEALRKENDSFRHPHRKQHLVLGYSSRKSSVSALEETQDASPIKVEELPRTTRLLLEAQLRNKIEADKSFWTPLYNSEDMLEEMQKRGKFDNIYSEIHASVPIQRRIGNYLQTWGVSLW